MRATDQECIDTLADILWWIKGYRASEEFGGDFGDSHIEALRLTRAWMMDYNRKQEESN